MLNFTELRSIEMTLVDIWAILDTKRADPLRLQHAMRELTHIHTFIASLNDCIHHKKKNAYERFLLDLYVLFQILMQLYEDAVHPVDTPLIITTGDK